MEVTETQINGSGHIEGVIILAESEGSDSSIWGPITETHGDNADSDVLNTVIETEGNGGILQKETHPQEVRASKQHASKAPTPPKQSVHSQIQWIHVVVTGILASVVAADHLVPRSKEFSSTDKDRHTPTVVVPQQVAPAERALSEKDIAELQAWVRDMQAAIVKDFDIQQAAIVKDFDIQQAAHKERIENLERENADLLERQQSSDREISKLRKTIERLHKTDERVFHLLKKEGE